jgi:hypothetical protein
MGFLKNLFGKKTDEEGKEVEDFSTIILGVDTQETAKFFRSKGIQNILLCWTSVGIKELTWPIDEVKNLKLCFTHHIPVGVINYDKWYGQVMGSAMLDRWGKNPEIKISSVPSEKKGMILLHWDEVDQEKCLRVAITLEKSVQEWS